MQARGSSKNLSAGGGSDEPDSPYAGRYVNTGGSQLNNLITLDHRSFFMLRSEPGFDTAAGNTLSASDRAAAAKWKRPTGDGMDEHELQPLSTLQKASGWAVRLAAFTGVFCTMFSPSMQAARTHNPHPCAAARRLWEMARSFQYLARVTLRRGWRGCAAAPMMWATHALWGAGTAKCWWVACL